MYDYTAFFQVDSVTQLLAPLPDPSQIIFQSRVGMPWAVWIGRFNNRLRFYAVFLMTSFHDVIFFNRRFSLILT